MNNSSTIGLFYNEATYAFTFVTAWKLAHHAEHSFIRRLQMFHYFRICCLATRLLTFALMGLSPIEHIHLCWTHVHTEIVAETQIDQPLFELGFILRKGGQIEYADDKKFDLSSLQMHLNYHPFLTCTTTLPRSYTETLDFLFETSFMQQFMPAYTDIIQPYLDAQKKEISCNSLGYSPFVHSTQIQSRLMKIRRMLQVKPTVSKNEAYHMLRVTIELFEQTCKMVRDLAYPRLFDTSKSIYDQFESAPLTLFDGLPTVREVSKRIKISPMTLGRLIAERHDMTAQHFITQKWVEAAARNLRDNYDQSIESIVFNLGWSSPAQFSNAFKRIMGQSPTDYRHNFRPKGL